MRDTTDRGALARLFAKPTAFLPLICSALALIVVLCRISLLGIAPGPDEGIAAHLFQILIAAQIPIVAVFAIRYLPRAPLAGLSVVVSHIAAVAVAMAPVAYFRL